MTSSSGRIGISEAYDYRVALPLVVVALLGLLFVEATRHKPIALQSTPTSTSSSKRLVKHQSTPSLNFVTNMPTLSPTVSTQDLAPGETPYDIQTATPQNNNGNAYGASNSSTDKLQNSSNSDPSSSPLSKNSNTLSTQDITNIINGITNAVIK